MASVRCLFVILFFLLNGQTASGVTFPGIPRAGGKVIYNQKKKDNNNNNKPSLQRTKSQSVLPNIFVRALLAGGTSRAIAQAVLYPIDALRTLAQTRDGQSLADVGWGALVRGSLTTSSFALFIGALQFSIFGACRERIGPLAASALGAAGSCIVSVPQEVIKQRLVAGIYPSFRAAVASIAKDDGLLGFYSAWKPTMARNVPFVVITFTSQDWLRSYLLRRATNKGDEKKQDLSALENTLVGMAAAFVAGVVTNPLDVIKTRMMTQAASIQQPYTSALDCFLTILKKEGPKTFYAGFPQRTAYMCLLWGLTFSLNAKVNRLLTHYGRQ